LDPLKHLLKIRTWETEWKRVIDKIVEWAAWPWANAKINKENISIMRQSANISKDNMEDYNLVMFTHAMDFFKEHTSLKKLIPQHFHKLIGWFVNRKLGNTWEFVIHRIHESSMITLCNSK
jgi:hypothetical protein